MSPVIGEGVSMARVAGVMVPLLKKECKKKKGDKVRRQFGGGKRERRDENEQENSKNGDRVSKLSESVVDRISVLPLDDIVICRTLLLASVGFGGFVGGGGCFPFGGGRRRGC